MAQINIGRFVTAEMSSNHRTAETERVMRADESADAGEVVAALPFGGEQAQEALHGVLLGGVGGKGEGFAAGEFEEFFVAQRVGNVEAEVAGLAGAEKFAGAAEEEIGFGDFEAVRGAHH